MLRVRWVIALVVCASTASAQDLAPPPPLAPAPLPAPRVVEERGASPMFYRLSPRLVLPLFRTNFGARFRSADGDASVLACTLDVSGGTVVRLGRASRYGALVEVGYSWSGFSQHLATVGLGALTGLGAASDFEGKARHAGLRVGVIAHALAGSSYGRWSVGERAGVLVAYSNYGVEIAHQALRVDGRTEHEFHLVLSAFSLVGEFE